MTTNYHVGGLGRHVGVLGALEHHAVIDDSKLNVFRTVPIEVGQEPVLASEFPDGFHVTLLCWGAGRIS